MDIPNLEQDDCNDNDLGNGQRHMGHIGCKDTLGFETKCDLTYITFFGNIIVHYCHQLPSPLSFIIIIITMTSSIIAMSVLIMIKSYLTNGQGQVCTSSTAAGTSQAYVTQRRLPTISNIITTHAIATLTTLPA